MTSDPAKDAARARVIELVRRFQRYEADYLQGTYNETQARTEFITPLLVAFGWDVHNNKDQPRAFRDVIEEATIEVDDGRPTKKPDYELRLARQRKLFVEAKKPSVPIDRDRASAFQARRYGYSASLPIVVLTNFYHLAVYDCRPMPMKDDAAHFARCLLVRYDEFEARFDELWPLLSRQAICSGDSDRRFTAKTQRRGTERFDGFFLRQMRSWRKLLAADIYANTRSLSPIELSYAVQIFLLRIIFLRICEDRGIEQYGMLKDLSITNTFDALMVELHRADECYNSGLFHLLDDERLGVRISDSLLRGIIAELYYPQSPYTFTVVEAEVLGAIYEQFLGEVITVNGDTVDIVPKPEVGASDGVVPTPRYIVDEIVKRTLSPALEGKSPADLANFTAADICCGSGVFLLSVYEFLLDHYLSWYLANDRAEHIGRTIYEASGNQWRLTFEEKRRILLAHVRGVDIDPNAVEVARFSLLLKLVEDETACGLKDYVARYPSPALPSLDRIVRCGNSLVSRAAWATMPEVLVERVNPFNWPAEFPAEIGRGGFDVIVANPPYIRIQHMVKYSPEEVGFYKSPASLYSTARQGRFDKYFLFIERALALLCASGRLGVIVPHKFMTNRAGRTLRQLVTRDRLLDEVVHFGVQQVFGRKGKNYTCVLVLDRRSPDAVHVERVSSLEAWRYGGQSLMAEVPATSLGEPPWQFIDRETHSLFQRILVAFPERLGQLAEILVPPQTSADRIYIFRAAGETADTITRYWNGRDWPIERGILRPCLQDVPLNAYARPQPNAWMIFPYRTVPEGRGFRAHLIQPDGPVAEVDYRAVIGAQR